MADELGYSQPDASTSAPKTADDEKTQRTRLEKVAFLKTARERFKSAQTAEKDQRRRELDDLSFYAGEQWPKDIRDSRAGQSATNGLPPVPARPCLTINKTRQPIREVLNQERESDMGIEIVAADDFGDLDVPPIDDSEIKLREGLVRRIQRESAAADARTWAFMRSTIAGRGFYAVLTRYVPGKTNDQEIYIHRFYNQAAVTIDPSHEQPDGSDAEWGFVGNDLSEEQYRAEFPQRNGKLNRIVKLSSEDFRALGEEQPDWFTYDGEQRCYRVVDYWYTERTTRDLVTLADGSVEWADEAPKDAQIIDRRSVVEKSIKWAKLDGCDDDVLDETDWPGPDLPIVKVLGEELQPYDKERRVEGMVRSMREPGQGFNYMVSSWVERVGLAPLPPIMLVEGQQEGYEAWYQAANTRTMPYLPYRATDLEGRPVAAPPFVPDRGLGQVIGPLAQSVAMFDAAIQATSAVTNPALGQSDPSVKSGKHAQLLAMKSQQGTSNYLDNLQRSIRYEGQIINNLLYAIYGRPGRIARILNGEGESETVMLHQPYMQQGKRLQPVPTAQPPQPGQPAPQGMPAGAQHYTLTKDARFNVIIKVAKSFNSRREQEASIVGELLSAAPQLMTWFGDLFFKNQDGPGHQEMADRAKVMLDPKILQMQQAKAQGQDIPPAVQAQLAQAMQQAQQAGQMVQQLQAEKAAKTAEMQGHFQIEQMKLQTPDVTALQIAEMNNAAKIEVARITAAKEASNIAQEAAEERLSTGLEQQHETVQNALDRAHDVVTAVQAQQHAQAVQTQSEQASAQQQAADQAHEAQQAQQQQQAAAQQQQQQPQGGQ